MTFQKLLNDYLTQLGCTARELSAVSGISAPVISRYRSGSHSPDLAQCRKLSAGIAALAAERGWKEITQESVESAFREVLTFREGFDWLHLSGITPALSKSCADFILKLMRTAKEKGLTVSFDGNFLSLLWSWEEARDYCTLCLPYIDVLFGIEPYHLWKDEADHSKGDHKDGLPMNPSYEAQDEVFGAFVARYPNLKCIARHVRTAHSGSENSLKAFMWYDGHAFESKLFTFNILDRVGGGDAFAGGLNYAYMNGYKPMDMINFAVASSVIKHTIHGGGNLTDDVDSIRNLMNMNYDIKR